MARKTKKLSFYFNFYILSSADFMYVFRTYQAAKYQFVRWWLAANKS